MVMAHVGGLHPMPLYGQSSGSPRRFMHFCLNNGQVRLDSPALGAIYTAAMLLRRVAFPPTSASPACPAPPRSRPLGPVGCTRSSWRGVLVLIRSKTDGSRNALRNL